jgi:Xaa-Pro aminopeptidase
VAADRRAARQAALVSLLHDQGLEGLLVTHRPNIRYLTGFSGSAGAVVVTAREALLVTDFRYDAQARAEARGAARVEIDRTSVWERLLRELAGLGGVTALGYESHVLAARDVDRLTQAAEGRPWRWTATVELVERLRARKDPDEVAALRAAAAAAEAALAALWPCIRPGQTEIEVVGLLERELRRAGSEDHPFPAMVAAGERSALPHARAGHRPLAAGDLLLIDCGVTLGGYCADLTRTVVVGARATAAQRALYELVWTAQQRALTGIRAGQTGREADALARDFIVARGFGDAFGHSLGHGLGLEVHEAPRVSQTNADPLPVDAVITLEPGVYLAGQGGVRLEDDVHLGAQGPVALSRTAPTLLELT